MGPKPKNKGHTNFYDCCDLTKKVYLSWSFWIATKGLILAIIFQEFLFDKLIHNGVSQKTIFRSANWIQT